MARRYPRDPTWAREALCDAYLEPDELWFYTFVDRRDHSILCTANRHYAQLDEPTMTIEPALEAIFVRLETDDPDLVAVPRMPNAEREAHMVAFAETIDDPTARATFDARARAMRADWDHYWRPGSFRGLADKLGPADERWRARIWAAAEAAIAQFCTRYGIALDGLAQLVFE